MFYGQLKVAGLDNFFIPHDAGYKKDGKYVTNEPGIVEKYSPHAGGALGLLGAGALGYKLGPNVTEDYGDIPTGSILGFLGLLGGHAAGSKLSDHLGVNREKQYDEDMKHAKFYPGATPLEKKKFDVVPSSIGGNHSFRGKLYAPYIEGAISSGRLDDNQTLYNPNMTSQDVKSIASHLRYPELYDEDALRAFKEDVSGSPKELAELGKMFDHYSKQNAKLTNWH
jgi:hypothetical protein